MAPRNPNWYRIEAGRLRHKAARVKDDTALQNSYLALALEYDRVADTIEQRPSATGAR
jgi:hypothetical protein